MGLLPDHLAQLILDECYFKNGLILGAGVCISLDLLRRHEVSSHLKDRWERQIGSWEAEQGGTLYWTVFDEFGF